MSSPITDATLNSNLRSWVESANDPATDFPIQNLPLGSFDPGDGHPHVGTAIGDQVVDIDMLMHAQGVFGDDEMSHAAHHALHHGGPNILIGADPRLWRFIREKIQAFLTEGPVGGQQLRRLREKAVLPMRDVKLLEPVYIPNYTDFYASIHHARNVGAMFRPDNPLLPNYKHIPIGYHGRASSIVVSGTDIHRPRGQTKADGADAPTFGPCKRLDYELELGCIIGKGNEIGHPIPIDATPTHIFGFCLVNDWSARDVQAWEYQPLGPFLAKNFSTSISPWIVTLDALQPFRVPGPARASDDPQPLEYLRQSDPTWSFDVTLEVHITSRLMRDKQLPPHHLSRGSFRDMYWTITQMIAHHTSNGCNLHPGDLLASGTISGTAADSRGCLLELTWAGNGPDGKPLPRKPVSLPTGESRTFLEDGDEIIIAGWCEKPGHRRIGFGECRGTILPAV
ncbi:MAG: fumarylacetoacetase [Phycisphaerales bacterium]